MNRYESLVNNELPNFFGYVMGDRFSKRGGGDELVKTLTRLKDGDWALYWHRDDPEELHVALLYGNTPEGRELFESRWQFHEQA